MTAPLWASLLLLGAGAAVILGLRLPPERRLAAAVLAAAVGLALARLFALAVPVAMVGIALWRRGARGIPQAGGRSEINTGMLRMTLDHTTGAMDGEVLAGRLAGRWLSELSDVELRTLADETETSGDEDSLALLIAYLDRRGVEREATAPPRSGAAVMTETEALGVLGLEPGASVEEVRRAYHRLMKRVHPDLGGSDALAAMLNAAKDRLDPE